MLQTEPNVPQATLSAQGAQASTFRDFVHVSSRVATSDVQARMRRRRLMVVTAVLSAWVALLVYRLLDLQVTDRARWQEWAFRQHFSEVSVAAERAPILDRNGKILAVSVPSTSIFVRPRAIRDKEAVARSLSAALELPYVALMEKVQSKKPFVWVARQIPRAKGQEIEKLKLSGVGAVLEARRLYPYNQVASSLIGKVGLDGNGLLGAELLYEDRLQGEGIVTRAVRDALGKHIDLTGNVESSFDLPKGKELSLTIDADISAIVSEEIEKARKDYKAQAVFAVMLDPDTGEILALGQSPTLNFNADSVLERLAMRNLAAELVFEPGSILKPLVAAAALHDGVVHAEDLVDCENGRYDFGSHTIKDVHPSGVISVRDVVVRSSNIGMTKIGVKLGAERLYAWLQRFGIGLAPGLGLPGESAGILRPVKSWAKIDVATHSYGQGVAVSPLQLVRAFSVLINGGRLNPLSLILRGDRAETKQVLDPKTAEKVKDMLVGVVTEEHGTGQKAAVEGIVIGGKTGTAQKAVEGSKGYRSGAYVSSFVGFADARTLGVSKQLVLMVTVDEPNTDSIYGGVLAAPVFKRIVEKTVSLMMTRQRLS